LDQTLKIADPVIIAVEERGHAARKAPHLCTRADRWRSRASS